jgi:lipooligosaccharide transport system ATP-binding protein
MNNGKKIIEGAPTDLLAEHIEKYVLEIINISLKTKIKKEKGLRIDRTENRIFLFSNKLKSLESISKKFSPGDCYLRQSNLEDLFLKFTGRNLNE